MELFIAILTILVVSAPVVWFILRTIRRAEDPKVMIVKWILTVPVSLLCLFSVSIFGPVGPFVIVFCAIIISIIWTPHLAAGMAKPITSLFDGGTEEPDPH